MMRFVAVSRLVRWKGVEETIRAFAQVRKKLGEVSLEIVGDGPQENHLRSLVAELQLDRDVHFHGARSPEQVREILTRSDVFVQHSLTDENGWVEGFGVSLAEAASVSLPIVATESGGIPDQVLDGETGILIKERDVSAMAEAMCRLATDPELRRRLGSAGQERMVRDFDSAGQIAKLEDVLLAAAERSRL